MTRDRIYLISEESGKVNSYYTLGAVSDESNLNMVIRSEIYGDNNTNPFNKKDLVTKAIDLNSFKQVSSFEIDAVSKLKSFAVPQQPYKLKIGSGVRYKGKSYQIIGFYYNTFAQRNVVSPILFNPQNMVNDALNLLYGVKTDDEVQDIINENFRDGKYDDDFNFPLLPSVTDFKDYLSNITEPPLTTLDVIQLSKPKDEDAVIDLKPYKFEPTQVDFSDSKVKAKGRGLEEEFGFAETFEDFRIKNTLTDIKPFEYSHNWRYKTVLEISKTKESLVNLPYNLVEASKLPTMRYYQTLIGQIQPIYMALNQIDDLNRLKYVNDFSSQSTQPRILFKKDESEIKVYKNGLIELLLLSKESTLRKVLNFELDSKAFIDEYEQFILHKSNWNYRGQKDFFYILKPETYYGRFYFSSGYEDLNPNTDSDILPFGSVFQKGGIYYYVLKYVRTEKDIKCFCIKTSTRNDVIEAKFSFSNKSEIKKYLKIFTKKEVYNAFKKEGHIFDIEDTSYSMNQLSNDTQKNPSLVTDLFLKSRQDQMQVIEQNFPKLNDTVIGILSLLDKSIRSRKGKVITSSKDLIYISLSAIISDYGRTYPSYDLEERAKDKAEKVFSNPNIIESIKSSTNAYISDVIYELGNNTSYIKLLNEKQVFFALKTFEEYQKYLLVRSAINLYRNLDLLQVFKDDEDFQVIPPQNIATIMTSDYFLGDISQTSFTFSKNEDGRIVRLKDNFNSLRFAEMNAPSMKVDFVKLAQSMFVLNALRLLIYNIRGVIYAHINQSSNQYIQNSNLLQYLKQFDLTLGLAYIIENYNEVIFSVGSYTDDWADSKIEIDEFNGNDSLYFACKMFMDYNQSFVIKFKEEDSKEAFIQLIKAIDLIYNYEFLLTDKIVENTSDVILIDFPRPKPEVEVEAETETDDDMFDDDDIFSEALEDLGEEFLDEIDEIINIDIEDF